VSLPAEVYALYKAFSRVSRQSMSSLLAEIAVTSAPTLERVLRVAVAAQEAEASRREGLKQAMWQVEQELGPMLSRAQTSLGLALDKAESAVTAAAGAQRRQPSGRGDPRPSNTGVRSPRKQGKKRLR